MASVRREQRADVEGRPMVRWRVFWRLADGTQRNRTFTREKDARRFAAERQTEAAAGRGVDPNLGRQTLAAWIDVWKPMRMAAASTIAKQDSLIATHIVPALGDYPIGRLDALTIQQWVAGLSSSPATVRACHGVLHRILAGAVSAGQITHNAAESTPLPRVRDREMRFLDPDEVSRLADCVDERWRALVLVAAYGGLRIGELAALRRGRVGPSARSVRVEESASEVRGAWAAGPTKTPAARRTVPLPRQVAVALASHLVTHTGPEREALVFTGPRGGPLRVAAWRRRVWRPATEAAGVAPLRIHDLRHTAVAMWIAAGGNPLQVSRRAGHTKVAFTLDRYGHLYDDGDDSLTDALERIYVEAGASEVAVLRNAGETGR